MTPFTLQRTWKSVAAFGLVIGVPGLAPADVRKTSPVDPAGTATGLVAPGLRQKPFAITPVCGSMFTWNPFAELGAAIACPTGLPFCVKVTDALTPAGAGVDPLQPEAI